MKGITAAEVAVSSSFPALQTYRDFITMCTNNYVVSSILSTPIYFSYLKEYTLSPPNNIQPHPVLRVAALNINHFYCYMAFLAPATLHNRS